MLQHQRVLGHKHPRSSAKNFIIRRLHLEQRTPNIHPSAPQIYWYRRIWMRDSHLPEKEWIDLPSARLDAGGYLRGVVVASGEESAIGPPVWPTLCRPQMNSDTDRSVQRLVSFELCLHSRLLVFPHSYHCYEEHPTLKVVTPWRTALKAVTHTVLLGFKSREIPRTKSVYKDTCICKIVLSTHMVLVLHACR